MHHFAAAFKLVVSQFVVANLRDGAGFMSDLGDGGRYFLVKGNRLMRMCRRMGSHFTNGLTIMGLYFQKS